MTEQELAQCIDRHNGLKIVTAVLLAPASAVVWIISYWVMYGIFYFAFASFQFQAASQIGTFIAIVAVIALGLEGLRYGKVVLVKGIENADDGPEFSTLSEISRTLDGSSAFGGGFSGFGRGGNIVDAGIFLAQVALSAPHMAVHAIYAFRSRVFAEPHVVARAAEILQLLDQKRKWVAADQFPVGGAALFLLDRLHLIWSEIEGGALRVRIPPGGND